jgi:hypothetical protein
MRETDRCRHHERGVVYCSHDDGKDDGMGKVLTLKVTGGGIDGEWGRFDVRAGDHNEADGYIGKEYNRETCAVEGFKVTIGQGGIGGQDLEQARVRAAAFTLAVQVGERIAARLKHGLGIEDAIMLEVGTYPLDGSYTFTKKSVYR